MGDDLRGRSYEGDRHYETCDSLACPCFIHGRSVVGSSHWELLLFIAKRRPELLREALAEVQPFAASGAVIEGSDG